MECKFLPFLFWFSSVLQQSLFMFLGKKLGCGYLSCLLVVASKVMISPFDFVNAQFVLNLFSQPFSLSEVLFQLFLSNSPPDLIFVAEMDFGQFFNQNKKK